MVWYAEQNNQLWPVEGTSGESSICVPTSTGCFIGDKMRKGVNDDSHYRRNRERLIWESKERYRRQVSTEKGRMKRNLDNRQRYQKLRKAVFAHYGGVICVDCNEDDIIVLTIDHIKGGGTQHRLELGVAGGSAFYTWLRKNNYPEGYQVVCMNCNWRRRMKRLYEKDFSIEDYSKLPLPLFPKEVKVC